jgi:hypothetical protein
MQVIQIVRHGLVPANHSDVNHLHVADHACTNMTFVAGNKLLDQGRLWNSVLCPRIEGPSAPVPIPLKCSTSSCNKRKHSQKTCLKTKSITNDIHLFQSSHPRQLAHALYNMPLHSMQNMHGQAARPSPARDSTVQDQGSQFLSESAKRTALSRLWT